MVLSSKMKRKSPRQIILFHFEAHQQQQLSESAAAKSRKNHLSAHARARRVQEELEPFFLAVALGTVSLNHPPKQTKKKGASTAAAATVTTNADEYQQEVANAILDVCHSALATELSADSQASVDATLELAAALSILLPTRSNNKNSSSKQDNNNKSDKDQTPPMLVNVLLPCVLNYSQVLLDRVRVQACHWLGYCVRDIAMLCEEQKDDKESLLDWTEDCLADIQTALLVRLQDKSQLVRHAAIRACGNFFIHPPHKKDDDDDSNDEDDDDDPNDDILQGLLWSCANDTSFANRIQAIMSLPGHNKTAVDHIVFRIRDVHAKVRVQALDSLRQMGRHITTFLSPQQCANIVQAGLTDRCAATKLAASKLICAGWMKAFKYNPLALLQHMEVAAYENECEKVLLVIFGAADQAFSTPLLQGLSRSERQAFSVGVSSALVLIQQNDNSHDDEAPPEPANLLEPESVFFSRVACQRAMESKTMSSNQKANVINQVVPDVTILCQVLRSQLILLKQAIVEDDQTAENITFVCTELLRLAKMCDLQEEGSRRHFSTVMRQVLASLDTPDDMIEVCLKAWNDTSKHDADFLEDVAVILETLSNGSMENETGENIAVVLRILLILSIVLETLSPVTPADLVTGFKKFVIPAVTHEHTSVREAGVRCFGNLGFYAENESRLVEFKPLLLRVASHADEKLEVRAQALLTLCDWALVFSDVLTPCDIDDEPVSLMSLVTDLLNQSQWGGIAVAAEVAVKLLFSGKFCDSEVIAQLLILFFDEQQAMKSTRRDYDDIKEVGSPERLQQLLSLFFPAYAIKSPTGRDALLGSIGPLLIEIHRMESKPSSTIKPGTVVNMINYICGTASMGMTGEEGKTPEPNSSSSVVDENDDDTVPTKTKDSDSSFVASSKPGTCMSASIQIAQFLVKVEDDLGQMMLRSLCKLMATMSMRVVNSEDSQALLILKNYTEELGMVITDPTSLRSLATLNEALANVSDDDETDVADDDEEEDEETEDEEAKDKETEDKETDDEETENKEDEETKGEETEDEETDSEEDSDENGKGDKKRKTATESNHDKRKRGNEGNHDKRKRGNERNHDKRKKKNEGNHDKRKRESEGSKTLVNRMSLMSLLSDDADKENTTSERTTTPILNDNAKPRRTRPPRSCQKHYTSVLER